MTMFEDVAAAIGDQEREGDSLDLAERALIALRNTSPCMRVSGAEVCGVKPSEAHKIFVAMIDDVLNRRRLA
jgi:hypothetical protein